MMFLIFFLLILVVISLDRFRIFVNLFVKCVLMEMMVMIVCIIYVFLIGLCIFYFIVLEFNDKEDFCDEDWLSFGYR